jgi:hypothetical protein
VLQLQKYVHLENQSLLKAKELSIWMNIFLEKKVKRNNL